MNYLKQNHLSIAIIAFLVIQALSGGSASFGAVSADTTTVGNPWIFSSTGLGKGVSMASTTITAFKVGLLSNQKSRVSSGSCTIRSDTNTIAASSTKQVDCQGGAVITTALADIPAWALGDTTFVSMSSSTPTTFAGLTVLGTSASTTAGYITVNLYNGTGTTFTWTAAASSSWSYYFAR